MGIDLHVGTKSFEIGAPPFFTSFFSTIYVRLENESWGSRFPRIMNELYQGRLAPEHAAPALAELKVIQSELARFPPADLVWDYEFRDRRPPWGDKISPRITSLASYFWTSDGKDLFAVLATAFELARKRQQPVLIE